MIVVPKLGPDSAGIGILPVIVPATVVNVPSIVVVITLIKELVGTGFSEVVSRGVVERMVSVIVCVTGIVLFVTDEVLVEDSETLLGFVVRGESR